MSPLTVQDGKLLLRDGKLGTEQGCCCKKPCNCDANNVYSPNAVPLGCDIDYIAVQFEFSFGNCGAETIVKDVLLNRDNSWIALDEATQSDGCKFGFACSLLCVNNVYRINFSVSGLNGSDNNGNPCCGAASANDLPPLCDIVGVDPPYFGAYYNCPPGQPLPFNNGPWQNNGTLCLNGPLLILAGHVDLPQQGLGSSCCPEPPEDLVLGEEFCEGMSMTIGVAMVMN